MRTRMIVEKEPLKIVQPQDIRVDVSVALFLGAHFPFAQTERVRNEELPNGLKSNHIHHTTSRRNNNISYE